MRTHYPILVGIAVLAALSVFFADFHRKQIETDLRARTLLALSQAPIREASITADAQTIALRGVVSSEQIRGQVEAEVLRVHGVKAVRNLLVVERSEFDAPR